MDFDFKVPSTFPQDLLLIQDLLGALPPPAKHVPDSLGSSDDSIASTDSEVESEDEVEANLAPLDEDSGTTTVPSEQGSHSDSDSDTSSSDSEEGIVHGTPQRQKPSDDIDDDESGVITSSTYAQTKNEVVDPNIIIPTISEVEPCDALEKVGEIMSIVENIVVVRGLPVDNVNSLSERALDAESLLVFKDRKVLGYIHETFGPTSQPFYQVKFNQHYPLDTGKVWVSREVFHVPQRSHFVFITQLKTLRGSDASNIHDEEPADDEIEFSDDEKEAAFRAQRKKRRGCSASSSRQSTPARIHVDDMVHDTYLASNPYDAHGPYDDDYLVTRPSRPPPIPYDDPYADILTSDVRVSHGGNHGESLGEPSCESGEGGRNMSRGHTSRRGTRGRGYRNQQFWNSSNRRYRKTPVTTPQTFDSDSTNLQTVECAKQHGHADTTVPHSLPPSTSNLYFPEAMNTQNYQQPFIQPHINPRFASVFGFNLPSGLVIPQPLSQNGHSHSSQPRDWADMWTTQDRAGSEGEQGDMYKPM